MKSDRRFAMCLIAGSAILALAGSTGAVSATLGAALGAIVLGEISTFACVVAFTVLIWAAIQEGKLPDRATAE